ncbi:MAG: hypothetical protein J0L93_11210 [Deltaproteobacteria bacterium]|nr:hypothetical protein [Deltaproteobacteria bacterium]
MLKFIFVSAALFLASAQIFAAEISIERMRENHDQEIATRGSFVWDGIVAEKTLKACIPQESIPFPQTLPKEWEAKIFDESPMEALMKCTRRDCAFNFSPKELAQLEKAKSPDERKKLYWEFYKRRVAHKEKTDDESARLFIRSKDKAFADCDGAEFHKLLDQRPVANPTYRLSHIQYNPRMRPTTRLLQGEWFSANGNLCYAESLLFSDHYDAERIEVWSVKTDPNKSKPKTKIQLQIRHRVDLLNTWLRRLNKEGVRVELDDLIKSQLEQVGECFKKKH